MNVVFFASEKPRERLLGDAFIRGVRAHGDHGEIRQLDGSAQVAEGAEVAVMVGVKSRELWEANHRAGIHVVMLDKGYSRHRLGGPVKRWEYWRIAVDAHHPTRTLMDVDRPPERAEARGWELAPWRTDGEHILLAGSSAKYHAFYGLPDPTQYAERLAKKLKRITGRPVVYRPKPSWRDAVPVKGAAFSGGDQQIEDVLAGAWAVVTHGSNACFEAALAGVPCIVLGDAVAKPISSVRLEAAADPHLASEAERRQWLANLAWCQWTLHEMERGEAWATIRPQVYG